MLTHLSVKNLAIVSALELNFDHGMHVITGETGAGKSIIIDALGIVLGERASAEQIRAEQSQAEVTACFDLKKLPAVLELLTAQELNVEQECIIRRIINADGRSRAYINGMAVSVQQIKNIAPHLVHIHSQHQHHALLESDYQRRLLDAYANNEQLILAVNQLYNNWHEITQQIKILNESQQQIDRLSLLEYQIQEFENLNLQPDELIVIEQKHKQLSKSEEILSVCQAIESLLEDDGAGVLNQLHSATNQIHILQKITPRFNSCSELLKQAIINIEEAKSDLHDYLSSADLDPQELQKIEQRLSAIHALARKLKVAPEMLNDHYMLLCSQRDALKNADAKLQQLEQDLKSCETKYMQIAKQLSASRIKAAQKLSVEIATRLKELELPNAKFAIQCDAIKQHPNLNGMDAVNFMVTTNPGQPLGLLRKIASGGELSRISLAIQVISAERMATPTLILDEVDVGISGKTAAAVGCLMRELGTQAQILCITHLPQVAALGHIHFKVEKKQTKQSTSTTIVPLDPDQRVQELARLLGGLSISDEALAHARSLLREVN